MAERGGIRTREWRERLDHEDVVSPASTTIPEILDDGKSEG